MRPSINYHSLQNFGPVATLCLAWLVCPLADAAAQTASEPSTKARHGFVSNDNGVQASAAKVTLAAPAEACQTHCPSVPCEWLEFHGFSPAEPTLGFSVLKCPGATGQGEARRFFHLRTMEGRNGRLGLKEQTLRGVHFVRYFRRHGFDSVPITPSSQDLTHFSAALSESCSLSVSLLTEKTMVLEIAVACGGQERFRSRSPLSDIYFGMAVDAFHAPEANRIFLAVHLDAQYKWDLWSGAFGFGR